MPPTSNRNGYSTVPDDADAEPLLKPTSNVSPRSWSATTILCALLASLGGLSFGYDQGVIANVLVMAYFQRRFVLTPLSTGFMTAFLELGALLGSILIGVFGDTQGRGRMMTYACLVFIIGGAVQCAAFSLWHLVVGRGVGGVGVGMLSTLTPLYISEISPPHMRGALMSLEQLSIVSGVVLGFWIGYATRHIENEGSWRIPLALQLVPGIVLLLACVSGLLPTSPRWLVLRDREPEAEESLRRLRAGEDEVNIQIEFMEMRAEKALIQRTSAKDVGSWNMLFSAKYRPRTAIGVLMMAFQQWSGINALLYYGPTLLSTLGFSDNLVISGGIGVTQLVAVFPAIALIDRVGRKPLLRSGSAVMTLSHFVIAILIICASCRSMGAVVCIYVFTFAYGLSFGPIGWVLPSEVFPLSVRSRGVALSTASNWANNFLIGLLTPPLVALSAQGTFTLFAAACFAGYIWCTYWVPETRGVGLEEMDAVFRKDGESGAGREEVEMRRQIEEELGLGRLLEEAGRA
ncbi:general substrate transporter [Hymenopellis radicata]|nr:general substrate transporter [Hymenopellis radicata]